MLMKPRLIADSEFEVQIENAALLSAAEADALVDGLKKEVDRNWWIDANISVEFANQIIEVGEVRSNLSYIALGTMARGDSLKLLGKVESAWSDLEHAGQIFLDAHDEVGWARTRIGRLTVSTDVDCVQLALRDAARARETFERYGKLEFVVRLLLNTGFLYNNLGNYDEAVRVFYDAKSYVDRLGTDGEKYLSMVYSSTGYAQLYQGNYHQAQDNYERARTEFEKRGELSGAATAEQSIAYIERAQGHYRQALRVLLDLVDRLGDQLPLESALAKRGIVECYIYLNRYKEALELVRQVIAEYLRLEITYEAAKTYLSYLATIEAEMGNFSAAQKALTEAETIFASRGAASWLAKLWLRRGQIALKQGDIQTALQWSEISAESFLKSQLKVNYAEAMLLKGHALLLLDELDAAAQAGQEALQLASHCHIPSLRYAAHLLLGNIAEKGGNLQRAARRYHAASATVARVQRNLTITLRPSFLEDKGDALRSLIRLHLQLGQVDRAFEALERTKSQVLLGYLANRESLHWKNNDPQTQELIAELNRLRDEHQWFYALAQGQAVHPKDDEKRPVVNPGEAHQESVMRERRMKAITERLYLQGDAADYVSQLSLADIQSRLDEQTVLIEFYNDGSALWAFILTNRDIAVHPLEMTVSELDTLLEKLQLNIDCALLLPPDSPPAKSLTQSANKISGKLYKGLMQPLEAVTAPYSRLVIVPYGSLHYLPFNALYTGSDYLIEHHEIVILPAAGLITRQPVEAKSGALVLAHSWDHKLPHTQAEAHIVQDLFDAALYSEAEASRSRLMTSSGKILHIAAHGEYRIDQPELSYIHLADGHLLTDDLIQEDLSYELVTLSACETGRAKVAPGDELIGLGRGFLYAGTGALIASLWRVNDVLTVSLMQAVYQNLHTGASKSAALRDAQCTILAEHPNLHPAYWGAFQLIGDTRPLSIEVDTSVILKHTGRPVASM